MNHEYPEYILKVLRLYNGLDEEDTSRDEEFRTWSPAEVFEAVLNYEGLINYDSWIIHRIKDIFNVDLNA